MSKYELSLVFKSEEKEAEKTLKKVDGWIEAAKGKIVKTNKVGVKELSYPIKKAKSGFYVFLEVELEPASVVGIDRRLRIDPEVLRHLMVRI